MTWRAMWGIDHWPGHGYRDCATEQDAVAVAETVVATTGRQVTVFEIEGDGMTENGDSEPSRADLRRLGRSEIPAQGRGAERRSEGDTMTETE